MSEQLARAQRAQNENPPKANPRYRPGYHLSVPAGWLNDPNGFGLFQGRYHLFFQYHPYDTVWGPMHWGHWTSEDLVRWRLEPVALAPDEPYDEGGCFSGTSLEKDGKLYLVYTGVTREGRQQQCVAESGDGLHFTKWPQNPVIPSTLLGAGDNPNDFRDPKILAVEGGYRVIAAVREDGEGKLLSFFSEDMRAWRAEGVLWDGLGEMAECPDCFRLDGCDVIVVAVIGVPAPGLVSRQNAMAATGRIENGRFAPETPKQPLDYGLDFYAPQTALTRDGRRVLIGWALSWGDVTPTRTLGHGWAGTMTMPREMRVQDGKILQAPLAELETLRRNAWRAEPFAVEGERALPRCAGPRKEILLTARLAQSDRLEIRLMQTGDEFFRLAYDAARGELTCDRRACRYAFTESGEREENCVSAANVPLEDGRLTLHIFVDTSIIEAYAQNGACVMTALACPAGDDYAVTLAAEGRPAVETLASWDIVA